MKRLIVARRIRCTEAKPLGGHAHHGEHRDSVHLHAADAVADRVLVVAPVDVGHGQAIIEEGEVELPMFEHLSDVPIIVGQKFLAAFPKKPRSEKLQALRTKLERRCQNAKTIPDGTREILA